MTASLKTFETIGCCGIDCGLCPRFYTKGKSACPGCGGTGFKDKHPSCGLLTCCKIKKGFEVCSECTEYPCKRFQKEKEGFDSFVTHKRIFTNLAFIKEKGIEKFIELQTQRMNILSYFLNNFDDGRSKNYFCISCALLPLEELNEIYQYALKFSNECELKEKSRPIKNYLKNVADAFRIDLKLKNRK